MARTKQKWRRTQRQREQSGEEYNPAAQRQKRKEELAASGGQKNESKKQKRKRLAKERNAAKLALNTAKNNSTSTELQVCLFVLQAFKILVVSGLTTLSC